MIKSIKEKTGWLGRAWRALQAMDYSSFDYTLDRVGALEMEVRALKDEVNTLRADSSSRRIETTLLAR